MGLCVSFYIFAVSFCSYSKFACNFKFYLSFSFFCFFPFLNHRFTLLVSFIMSTVDVEFVDCTTKVLVRFYLNDYSGYDIKPSYGKPSDFEL